MTLCLSYLGLIFNNASGVGLITVGWCMPKYSVALAAGPLEDPDVCSIFKVLPASTHKQVEARLALVQPGDSAVQTA